jgi:NAD(P)-dependent dehydrogenase (short-subunit alcohol dehydrogenase family)
MSLFSLKKKNIIVMGGTSGLGLASAKAFISHGASVVVVGRSEHTCRVAASELGPKAEVISGDASVPETVQQAIAAFTSRNERIHGLFHVAGGSGRKFGDGPLHELTLDGWNETLRLNLTSVILSNQAIIQYFLKMNMAGSILNMSSVLGYSPSPKYFSTHAYAASKAAIIGFSQSIAAYYASSNIRVNVLAPSLFVTPMSERAATDEKIMQFIKTKQPLDGGRAGHPEDIAGAASFFMSDSSSFTTGQVLSVDGGWHLSEGQYVQ